MRLAASLMLATVFAATMPAASVYDYTLNSLTGTPTPLAGFKGKVMLIVNVASYCGYTYQYEGLQALHAKFKDQGFSVAGFPANNFGAQEPDTDAQIGDFCKRTYGVSFPMFTKVSVKGADMTPLYKYLTDKQVHPSTGGDIQWNFTKFLVDRTGKVIARFEPAVEPKEIESAVVKALKN